MLSNKLGFAKQQRSRGEREQGRAEGDLPLLLYLLPRWLLLFPVVALLSLGMSCVGRRIIPPKPVLEKQFDPLSLQDDDIWEELRKPVPAVPETALAVTSKPAVPDTSQRERPQYVQGFRVQIFASPDRQAAIEARQRAETVFGENVYLEFEAPYYKVRVGDCLSSVEAEKLLRKVRKKGYPDAFRVRTTIRLQPEE